MLTGKLKILIITPGLGSGGAQKVFKDQLNFYAKHYDAVGCIFNWDGALNEERDLNLFSLDVPGGSHVISKAYFFIQRIIKLRQIKRSHKIDICISHLEGADYVNILSRQGEKIICYIHGTKFHDKEIKGTLGWFRRALLMPILYRYASLILVVSAGIKNEFISQLRIASNKIKVITNGFDLKRIELLSQAPISLDIENLLGQNNFICPCSRMAPQKNQEIFLFIFSELLSKVSCKLMILGDGELRNNLIEKAKTLGLKIYTSWDTQPISDKFDIYFMGNQVNPFPYVSRSTVFALPSSWEGFPLALCEAMACGVPVIASDCPTGPAEIVRDRERKSNYGFLLPTPIKDHDKDLQLWVDTLFMLLKNQSMLKEYGVKSKTRVKDFSFEKMEESWLSVLDDLNQEVGK